MHDNNYVSQFNSYTSAGNNYNRAAGGSNEIDQMKKDQLYDLFKDSTLTQRAGRSQIRVAIQWIYSKVKLLEDIRDQVQK